MFKQNSKYRGVFLVFAVMFFATISVIKFLDFVAEKNGMKLITGIFFGIAAIFYLGEIYKFNKIKKASKERHD